MPIPVVAHTPPPPPERVPVSYLAPPPEPRRSVTPTPRPFQEQEPRKSATHTEPRHFQEQEPRKSLPFHEPFQDLEPRKPLQEQELRKTLPIQHQEKRESDVSIPVPVTPVTRKSGPQAPRQSRGQSVFAEDTVGIGSSGMPMPSSDDQFVRFPVVAGQVYGSGSGKNNEMGMGEGILERLNIINDDLTSLKNENRRLQVGFLIFFFFFSNYFETFMVDCRFFCSEDILGSLFYMESRPH